MCIVRFGRQLLVLVLIGTVLSLLITPRYTLAAAPPTLAGPRIQQDEGSPDVPPTSDDPAPTATSPFRRKDLPPGGVSSLMMFGQGGAGEYCVMHPGGEVSFEGFTPGVVGCQLKINDEVGFRFEAFPGASELTLEMSSGTGWSRQVVARVNQEWEADAPFPIVSWRSQVGDPYGDQTLTVSAGGKIERYTVSVGPPPQPLAVASPQWVRPGNDVTIELAGYPAHAAVSVYLYRRAENTRIHTWAYVTALGQVVTDGRGEGQLVIRTLPDDPEDGYMVQTDPPPEGYGTYHPRLFAVSREPTMYGFGPQREQRQDDLERFAKATIEQANQVWASVVAKDGAPIEQLACVYDGDWLAYVRGQVEAMRSTGQYREARMIAPVEMTSVQRRADGSLDVQAVERWDDRLMEADGTLARTSGTRVEQHYVLREVVPSAARHQCDAIDIFYIVVESQLTRSS